MTFSRVDFSFYFTVIYISITSTTIIISIIRSALYKVVQI
jgi:hypothetical protein